jgi:hypothetical protein
LGGLWLASYIILWVVVAALSLLVVGLLQQVGWLNRHIQAQENEFTPSASLIPLAENGAIMLPSLEHDGPSIGSMLPEKLLETINGHGRVTLSPKPGSEMTLLVCLSALCEGCQQVADPLNALVDNGTYNGRVVVLMREDRQVCQAFLRVFPLHVPVVSQGADALMRQLDVHRTPLSLLYDANGTLIRKGVTRAHDDLLAVLGDASAAAAAQTQVFPPVAETSVSL